MLHAVTEIMTIAAVDTAWGPMLVATSSRGILAVARGTDAGALVPDLLRRVPGAAIRTGHAAAATWLRGWIAGGRRDAPRVDLRGLSAFDAAVYAAVHRLRWGERATYAEVALMAGAPGAARAVGNAMARCPLHPAVPCHRVVRAGDGWSGWGSGDRRKRELLEREL